MFTHLDDMKRNDSAAPHPVTSGAASETSGSSQKLKAPHDPIGKSKDAKSKGKTIKKSVMAYAPVPSRGRAISRPSSAASARPKTQTDGIVKKRNQYDHKKSDASETPPTPPVDHAAARHGQYVKAVRAAFTYEADCDVSDSDEEKILDNKPVDKKDRVQNIISERNSDIESKIQSAREADREIPTKKRQGPIRATHNIATCAPVEKDHLQPNVPSAWTKSSSKKQQGGTSGFKKKEPNVMGSGSLKTTPIVSGRKEYQPSGRKAISNQRNQRRAQYSKNGVSTGLSGAFVRPSSARPRVGIFAVRGKGDRPAQVRPASAGLTGRSGSQPSSDKKDALTQRRQRERPQSAYVRGQRDRDNCGSSGNQFRRRQRGGKSVIRVNIGDLRNAESSQAKGQVASKKLGTATSGFLNQGVVSGMASVGVVVKQYRPEQASIAPKHGSADPIPSASSSSMSSFQYHGSSGSGSGSGAQNSSTPSNFTSVSTVDGQYGYSKGESTKSTGGFENSRESLSQIPISTTSLSDSKSVLNLSKKNSVVSKGRVIGRQDGKQKVFTASRRSRPSSAPSTRPKVKVQGWQSKGTYVRPLGDRASRPGISDLRRLSSELKYSKK